MPEISLVIPSYNETENIKSFTAELIERMEATGCSFEIIFIDNASTDGTIDHIRQMCSADNRLKAIVNARNFGQIRSPFYGVQQAYGDAVIHLPSDGEVPSSGIPELIAQWKEGMKVVHAVKEYDGSNLMIFLKSTFQRSLNSISSEELTYNSSGYGLVDQTVITHMRNIKAAVPYYRGLLNQLSGDIGIVRYVHRKRNFGLSKNNLMSLTDYALVGLVHQSKIPLRAMMLLGGVGAIVSLGLSFYYLGIKLLYWDSLQLGIAPLICMTLFMMAVLMFFIGLLGEYLYHIFLTTRNFPMVVERERINFD